MLTSYHAHTAALVDRYCDIILVGDSSSDLVAINNVLRSRTKWSLRRIPQE
jgi:ketopantoate hydroxymethyltransferase